MGPIIWQPKRAPKERQAEGGCVIGGCTEGRERRLNLRFGAQDYAPSRPGQPRLTRGAPGGYTGPVTGKGQGRAFFRYAACTVACALAALACGASAFNVEGAFSVAEATEAEAVVAEVPVQTQRVTDFFETLNIRGEEPIQTEAALGALGDDVPTAYFVHGYAVSAEDAEDWFTAIFKRLWQSGMNARFCGVTWQGDEQFLTPDYYKNVENAFVAAERLADALKKRPGRKVVLAHSLGNMVVSAALQDFNAPIDTYFMLNSAVPSEAYDTEAPTYGFSTDAIPAGLIHDDWRAYPAKSWASMWHRHFLPHGDYMPTEADSARATLTWQGRFRDVPQKRGTTVYNYYSGEDGTTGDEVLELMATTPSPTSGFEWLKAKGRYSWQKQACFKGREHDTEKILEWFVASDEMGWGYEGGIENRPTPENVQALADVAFRTRPVFLRNPALILGDDASAIRARRDHLLAYAIPERSKPTGKTSLNNLRIGYQLDCQWYAAQAGKNWARGPKSEEESLNGRWLHSDIKDVAYPFCRPLFLQLIDQGALR